MRAFPAFLTTLLTVITVSTVAPAESKKIDFNRQILPILSDRCFACHGPDEGQRKGKLRLDLKASAFADRGGYHVLVPGHPEKSELIERIFAERRGMPPRRSKLRLSQKEKELLREWVKQGAEWEQHWAFVPPERPALPETSINDWACNPIDTFILARLEKEKLTPSPGADREDLLRRVTFSLTGLPPTVEEMDEFLSDKSPNAFEKVVNRLLDSPRYGEHFATPWLEASRYADTDGYQNDRYRYQSVWRDWLIMALNRNQPFDEFTIDQFAGDLLPNATLHQQIATGFHRNHRINSEAGSIPEEFHVENVVDRVDTTATVWLGLTLGCARCHDHKFDPISQKEYYQLFGYFNSIYEWGIGPNNGNSPPYVKVPKTWPFVSEENNKLLEPEDWELSIVQGNVPRPTPGGINTVMVLQDMKKPRDTYLLKRGAYDQPDTSEKLQPSTPDILGSVSKDLPRNRLGLAQWLVDPNHPLTARVTVNRIWQHHFGVGLVKTSENFGIQGEHPSHSQLLDWLATEFIRSGWDVKQMHRLIVTSATYRQSSKASSELQERDPENRLLARGPRLKLSAQMLRDQALAVSGLLVEKIGGPSVKPYMPPRIWRAFSNNSYKQDHGEKLYRRSLYTYWRRTIPPPTMMTLGSADRESCSVRKPRNDNPLQALTLMNNKTFVEASRLLAERMLKVTGNDQARLSYGYRAVTGHSPDERKLSALQRALNVFEQNYKADPAAAKKLLTVGEYPADKALNPVTLASWTMIANVMMNLDSSIHR